ncbi:DUF4124 domain-containing protein [Sedimenticola sp.]|uniref:DUF4124 domain-containing protein n=1 Tax=Sedimenticola sp. TaxID=1940285 RepID=UPI003D0FD3A9
MWKINVLILTGVCVGGLLATFPPAAFSATYRCEQDGVTVYSDTRCGPNAQQSGEVQNVYPGGLRTGEQQMLNQAGSRQSAPAAGDSSGSSYGERLQEQNEQRKSEGDKRRIPSKATSPWH